MKTLTYDFFRSLSADTIKLKRTPILWVALLGGLFITGLVFLIHYFSVEEINKPDTNPWIFYCNFGMTFVSILLAVPFVVLLTSSTLFAEHRSNAWKYLYSLPLPRGQIYFSKLVLILIILAITYLIFFLGQLLSGWLLGFLRPEYGFHEYAPQPGKFALLLLHSYLSALGVVGLHYWLSVRWKNFIVPVGIGLLGYIVSILFSMTNRYEVGQFFLYSYPSMLGTSLGLDTPIKELFWMGGLTNVEWFSLGFLVIFAAAGFIEESRKNIK